ncbi:MAG: hypothetical protein B7X48_01345 [Acidiphilium sp. 34-60-192]|nr:MAG: hypothetical protein B7X48_01345 [Acidiphilium sp. 34-60-192]
MAFSPMQRSLVHYPDQGPRKLYLLLVVLITIALYYALYAGGGVAPLLLAGLKLPFSDFVYILAFGNLIGAFASLLAGLADRFGRANLVVYGLLVVGLLIAFVMPNVTTAREWGITFFVVSFVEGIILVATPALIRDFSPQVGRATAMGFWTIGPVLGSLTVSVVTTLTLPIFKIWQSAYEICGYAVLAVFVLAFLFLKELAPSLRYRSELAQSLEPNAPCRYSGLRFRRVGDAAILLYSRRVRVDLFRHRVRLFSPASQYPRELELGHQCRSPHHRWHPVG